MIGEAAGSENVGQRLPGGGPTGVRERIAAWGRGARLAAVIVLALAVISLSLLVVIPLGSGSDELAVDVSLAGVDDLVVGEPGEVEVTVEVTQLGSLGEDDPVRLLGELTGEGADEVEVASVEGGEPVEVEVTDGQFLWPSDEQPLTVGDVAGGLTFVLELTVLEEAGPLELSVSLASGEPVPARVVRLSGDGRFETAVEASREAHPDGAATVYLTRTFAYADVLAAGAAAAEAGAPLLLAFEDSLPSVTRAEIERLAPDRIVLLGGAAALSDGVADQASDLVADTQRIAGADRYDTAAQIAAEAFDSPSTVLVTPGEDFEDALAAVPAAASERAPVLLTQRDTLPEPTAQVLAELAPTRIIVLGDETVVGDDVMSQLSGLADDVQRVAGQDRYETAVNVAALFFDADDVDAAVLVTGLDFHDALIGGPAAAAVNAPMLLTDWSGLPDVVVDQLGVLKPETIYVLGTLSAAIADDARTASTPDQLIPARARTLGAAATSTLGPQ